MPEPELVVVVPCYNEGHRLPVARFQDFAAKNPGVTFLFVDDGSSDHTVSVLDEMKRVLPQAIDVLRLPRNEGKGEAVRQGIQAGFSRGARFLAFWDADLATPLDVLPAFREVFDQRPEVDIVLGSRVKLLGRHIERRPLRHYLGRVFATAASFTLDLPVYDTQCGAKMFRATPEVAEVFAEPFSSRWIFDVELLARYLRLRRGAPGGPPVERHLFELPLPVWTDVAGSKVRPRDFFVALAELLRIHRRYPRPDHSRSR